MQVPKPRDDLVPVTFKLPGLGGVIPKEGSSELEPLNQ